MHKSKVFFFNAHDLPRRAGEMKEYSIDIVVPERMGLDVVAVEVGEEIHVDMRLESVSQGILVSAQISAVADGTCMRCLEPLELQIHRRIQELYRYAPEKKVHTKAQRKAAEIDDLDVDEDLMLEGDEIDLEGPIRDSIVLDLPINPVCVEDCPGLCPGCGVKWSLLAPDHGHEQIDPRWKGLAGLEPESPDFKN
jgi:uncharacterized protein